MYLVTVVLPMVSILLCQSTVQSDTALVDVKAFFDIFIGDEYIGRIVFGLMNNTAPLTVQNFIALADNKLPNDRGYKGSIFHRVINNFMIQGGEIADGKGDVSIYNDGGNFNDENFILKNHVGWLGMANAGPNTNRCQFYINTVPTHWLDDKHVVFGKVLAGMDVVKAIESTPTDSSNKPIKRVEISYSGSFPVLQPFPVSIP